MDKFGFWRIFLWKKTKDKGDNNNIYIKDFTIIPQGMYLIGYNSFNHYFYELTIPKEEYLYCNSSNITVKENIKINLVTLFLLNIKI